MSTLKSSFNTFWNFSEHITHWKNFQILIYKTEFFYLRKMHFWRVFRTWFATKSTTLCFVKNVLCHFFVVTVLGVASELKLVVVKIPFKCVFWIYWTLVFRKKLDHDLHPSTLNISYHKGGWRGKCWKKWCFVSLSCGLSISKSLRVRQIILFPTY